MKRSYTYLKGLLTLALAAFTGWMWAAELVIPYSFDGKTGNTEYAYEYQVVMPNTALTSFTTTIRYSGGSHRVEILSVKLLDGETEYTAVATGTEGNEVVEEGASYSGGNNYHNIYTFTNNAGFTANKVYTLQAMLKVTNANPSHNGNIKVSGGITLDVQPFSFGVNFKTADAENISTTTGAGFAKGDYAAPINWANYTADGGNHATYTIDTAAIDVSWVSRGSWNSGCSTDTDAGKLLHGYLDDTANNGRTKATVTISGLPENKKYAVALVLSGDGNGDANFNNRFSPVWINNEVYAYDSETTLVKGDEAKAIEYWGSRASSAAAAGLVEGTNVMFVEGLSGGAISITSAMDNQNVSRLTIAGVQVWVTDEAAEAPAAPEDKETISLNFYSSQGSVSGEAGLVAAEGWNNLGNSGSESALNVWTGEKAVSYPMALTYSSNNGYQWTGATDAFLKGYLDDGGDHAQVSLTGIPFGEYSVIVYAATDTADRKFRSVTINGQAYIGTPGATTLGYALPVYNNTHARYGASHALTAAYGTNALRVDGLSGDLTIAGGANEFSARGGIAAIQIINTGDALPDAQLIDWTTQPAEQLKTSALPELTNVSVQLKLAEGATLEMDSIITGHTIEIVGNNVTVNVTNLEISQAAAQAIFPDATVTTAYTETIGYTKDDVTYPLIFRGTTDANWATLSNWYIGTRTNGSETYWIPYTGTVVPGAPDSNVWDVGLIDGDLIGDNITADEDGYKVVTTPTLEGWVLTITIANGVHVKVPTLKKLQGTCAINVDATSKMTVTNKGSGNNAAANTYNIDAEEGLVFENMPMPGGTAYLGLNGSITTGTFASEQTIGGVTLDLGDSTLAGRKVVTRTLYTYTSGTTFSVAEGAVTTSVDTVTPEVSDILQNVGQYKFETKADGYCVSYVAYAEADEIGAMNTWTGTVDGNWATAGNWSSNFVPAEGADATISITADTTITIPEAGVTVGTLVVNGEGTLTIAGGKLTATKILANTSIAADETTLALAEMDIAEGKTVTYTTTTTDADPDTFGSAHALALKDLTGAGTFVKKGTGVIALFATDAEPAIDVQQGAIYVREAPTTAMNIAAKAGAEIRLAAWLCDFNNNANSLKLEGGAQLTLANGSGLAGTITIAEAAETPAKICGMSFGAATVSAAISGAGKVEFADGGSFGDATKYPCDGATIYTGLISGDLQVIISDTSAVTFTANNTYTGGTVIAEGVTVSVSNLNTIFGTGNVTGAGTVKIAGGTYNNLSLAQYTDANTTIVIPADNTVTGYFNNATWTCAAKIQLDGTLSLTNGFGAGRYTFTGPWTGAGAISLSHTSPADAIRITGDISGFTGNISVAGARALTFCAATTGDNQKYAGKICVHGDYAYTAKVNGTWSAPVVVENGAKIGGTGTIDNTLTFANGSIIDGAVTATGDVTLNGTVTVSGEAGATVLTCANAESLDLTKFAAPDGLKCIAEDGAVKLAVAKKTNFVVTVGEETVNCETVAEALGALAAGGSLQIAEDADAEALALTETLTIAADTTIDLNGKSLTSTADPAIHVTGGTLTLTGEGSITAPGVVIQQGTKSAGLTTKVIVGEGVLLTSFRTEGEDWDGDNVVLLYGKATLESAGVLLTYSKGYAAIQGSGGDAGADTSITITGGQVVNSGDDVAIYQPQAGTLTIEGGVISGTTGIEMRAGTLTVNGGEITATAEEYTVNKNGNGSTVIGAAIAVSPHAGVESITANITGGTIGDENTAMALAIVNTIDAMPPTISATIAADATINMDKVVVDISDLEFKENNGSYDLGMKTTGAIIKNEWYPTLQAAIDAAVTGDRVILLGDITASEIITINKAITLEGKGKTLTSTAGRAINVDTTGDVTIEDLTINAGERAINIINQAATVTINGVTATANNVAVMIATTAGAAQVSIEDSNLTGLMVVGVYGAGADVDIADSTIANVDANESENYGAITVGNTAENATVDVTNTTITVMDDSKKAYNFSSTATITGVDEVGKVVAMIGDAGFDTIEEAVAYAKAGDTIKLIANVTINSRLDIAQNVTIDLNGQTIAETMEDQFGAIYVKKGATLTIAATNGGEITTDGGIVIGNYGTVIVNGGTIAAGEDAEADVSIYNFYYQADWYGTTTINGGTVARIWNCGVATLADGEVTDVDNSGAMTITDATVTNIILRDGTDAPGIEGAGTLTAPEGLTVTTLDGQKAVYADGKYTVVKILTLPEELVDSPAAEAIEAAMEAAGVTEISSYTITTKGTADEAATVAAVAAVLEVFEVTPTVDANGVLTVAYEFGISKMTKSGDTITITAGVTGAEYREGVTVGFYADGEEVIGTAITGADSTEVSITADAANLNGKKITVKATK